LVPRGALTRVDSVIAMCSLYPPSLGLFIAATDPVGWPAGSRSARRILFPQSQADLVVPCVSE
jgi:hypothetical protein